MGLEWKGLWTERDGQTPCFVRILTVVCLSALFGIEALAVYHGKDIDPQSFAIACMTIVAGGAGAARLKLETEGQVTTGPNQ